MSSSNECEPFNRLKIEKWTALNIQFISISYKTIEHIYEISDYRKECKLRLQNVLKHGVVFIRLSHQIINVWVYFIIKVRNRLRGISGNI